VTPNSDWWDRAKLPPRPQSTDVRKREYLATLRKGEHAVTLEKRPVYGVVDWFGGVVVIGEDLIFSIDGHWRRMRVFKEDCLQVSTAVAETVARLEARGWGPCQSPPRSKKSPRRAIEAVSARREDNRRSAALKVILRGREPIRERTSRSLGDAVFALYAPTDAVILTTNKRDHKALARALGKEAVEP